MSESSVTYAAHERQMLALIDERDGLEERLNKFAAAVAPIGVIGEHSSSNDPWANALGLVTPAAEVDQIRAERDALKAAIADVRRLQEMTIATSCRVQAIDQATDTLAVLDRALTALDTPGTATDTPEATDD